MDSIDEQIFTLPYYDTNMGEVNVVTLRNHFNRAELAFRSIEMILERALSVQAKLL